MDREGAVQLSKRLQMLADMVTPGSRAADVGCDHGFLSIYLLQQGICPHVIAADIRTGPLSGAREHVAEHGLEAYIETRLSDGLTEIHAGEADTLICAGMGGRLMRRILKQGGAVSRSFEELILQPQSELEEFRAFLRRERYEIVQEDILCEEGKYYFCMKAASVGSVVGDGGEIPRRLADKYGGLLLKQRHPVLREYLEFMRGIYGRAAEQIRAQSERTPRSEGRLAEICLELAALEEAMRFYTEKGR